LVRAYYFGPQYAKDTYGRAARAAGDHGTIKLDARENDDGKWVVEIETAARRATISRRRRSSRI